MLEAPFVLEIFTYFLLLGYTEKQFDKKANVNLKI